MPKVKTKNFVNNCAHGIASKLKKKTKKIAKKKKSSKNFIACEFNGNFNESMSILCQPKFENKTKLIFQSFLHRFAPFHVAK